MSLVTPKPAAAFSALAIVEIDAVMFDERAKALAYQLASGAPDDVSDEQDVHAGGRESVSTGIVCT